MRQFRLLQSCLVSRPARSLWPTVVPRQIEPLQIGQRTIHASRMLRVESDNLRTAIREIQDKFVEAKDEYEMALESQGTTYAVEDNETARDVAAELYDSTMSRSFKLTDVLGKQSMMAL